MIYGMKILIRAMGPGEGEAGPPLKREPDGDILLQELGPGDELIHFIPIFNHRDIVY